jgi:excisionase family DNA binding protein
MAEGDSAGWRPTIPVPMKFYRGIKDIANFLEVHPDTARKLIREGKIPAKKDETGRWVLVNLDYYQFLSG